MSSEELITKQAEMVLAADPGVEGYNPRVWAYRNSIKALNWYSSVRKKARRRRPAPAPPPWDPSHRPVEAAPASRGLTTHHAAPHGMLSRRMQLDDPKYSSWFAKFEGFDDKTCAPA